MGIKTYRPTSAGRRHGSVLDYQEITTREPERSLLRPMRKKGGRNNMGRITARHRGGGNKRRYRLIDFVLPHLNPGAPLSEAEGVPTEWRQSILLVIAITMHNIPEGLAVGVAFGAAAAFALALKLDLPLFGTLAEISLSILATGVGVVEAILGRTYQTWTPPSSR